MNSDDLPTCPACGEDMIPEHDEIVGSEPDDVQHRTVWVCPECEAKEKR